MHASLKSFLTFSTYIYDGSGSSNHTLSCII